MRIPVIVTASCVIAMIAVVPMPSGSAAPLVQHQSVAATSTLAVIKTIRLGTTPYGVAVNDGDDTVYVANFNSGTVSVINGRTATEDDTITVGSLPAGVAVNQGDDTVYVTNLLRMMHIHCLCSRHDCDNANRILSTPDHAVSGFHTVAN